MIAEDRDGRIQADGGHPWNTVTSAHGFVVPFNYRVGGNWTEHVKNSMSLYALENDSRYEGASVRDFTSLHEVTTVTHK